MPHVHILQSSGGGNTVMVTDIIAAVLAEKSVTTSKVRAVMATADDFVQGDLVLLACPTYDHGVCHAPYEKLLSKMHDIDLTGKRFAVVGLGDNKYDEDYNIESATILEEFVHDRGGELVCESLRINKSPVDKLESIVKPWAEQLVAQI